jgi:hypothetical protein
MKHVLVSLVLLSSAQSFAVDIPAQMAACKSQLTSQFDTSGAYSTSLVQSNGGFSFRFAPKVNGEIVNPTCIDTDQNCRVVRVYRDMGCMGFNSRY